MGAMVSRINHENRIRGSHGLGFNWGICRQGWVVGTNLQLKRLTLCPI